MSILNSLEAVEQADHGEPKLKLCILAACPFPANHGTPGSIRELSEAIAERGHEVHIVTYHIGQDIPLRGVHVHRVKPLFEESTVTVGPTNRRPVYDLQMVFEAIKVIRRYKLDMIHAHGYEAALIATLARVATWKPFIYSAHNSMGDELASYDFFRFKWVANSLAWLLDAVVPRLGNWCIPHSENMKTFLEDRGLGKKCEPVVNFGIDFEDTPGDGLRFKEQYNLGDSPLIMYTGVMDHFQRLDLLLEAMVPVTQVVPDAKLILVSTIPNETHESNLMRKVDELGIRDNVVLTEPLELDDVREILPLCDVAVVPRPGAPGFPIKLLNYMAAARACVMFESSSSGLTDGEQAMLVKPDTSEALGDTILTLLKDQQLRERIAANGYRFVRAHHDRSRSAEQVCKAYIRMLEAKGRWKKIADRPFVGGDATQPVDSKSTATADQSTENQSSHSLQGTSTDVK